MKILSEKTEVTEDNYLIVAAKHYNNPQCSSTDEFYADLDRIKYIKRIINRYLESGDLSERLLLNHIIVFCNVFGVEIGVKMMAVKLEYKYWSVIKTILVFLKYIEPSDLVGIDMDSKIINVLREI
tara:strand:- start:12677 stop:13054 length:378 start_codon:yes stop_codon:yes gene_type:complete